MIFIDNVSCLKIIYFFKCYHLSLFASQIETTSDYKTSTLSRITEYIEEAKAASSGTEEILNKFARFYTPCVVGVALLIFLIPLIVGEAKVGFVFVLRFT